MFTGIKDKLLNVRRNVGLFSTDEPTTKSKEKPKFNEFAGSNILAHFQNEWVEIHNQNEENAKSADNVASQIEEISKNISRSNTNFDLITHILTSSNLTTNISQCLNQLQDLYSVCENVEQKLVELEVLIDKVEFEKLIGQHRLHLKNYKARKQESLNTLKASLEADYQKELELQEDSKKSLLEERQKVFSEAFKCDLEVYKSLGTIPKVDLSRSQNGAILEEIQLDYDQNELENFFNDENNDKKS